jgi:hypothetical protein
VPLVTLLRKPSFPIPVSCINDSIKKMLGVAQISNIPIKSCAYIGLRLGRYRYSHEFLVGIDDQTTISLESNHGTSRVPQKHLMIMEELNDTVALAANDRRGHMTPISTWRLRWPFQINIKFQFVCYRQMRKDVLSHFLTNLWSFHETHRIGLVRLHPATT